jgi:hypothetical protein
MCQTIRSNFCGNRNRHHNPSSKNYRLIKLLCIGRKSWEKLKELIDLHKRSYNKNNKAITEKRTAIISNAYNQEDLRVIMSTWYHGQFTNIKSWNLTEEQRWGDLTEMQQRKLKQILKGDF